MKVSRASFEMITERDPNPDTSYADQAGFEDEREGIESGRVEFYGVRARVVLMLPFGAGNAIAHQVETPGCWSIMVAPGGEKILDDVFEDECAVLETMLQALGVTVTDEEVL